MLRRLGMKCVSQDWGQLSKSRSICGILIQFKELTKNAMDKRLPFVHQIRGTHHQIPLQRLNILAAIFPAFSELPPPRGWGGRFWDVMLNYVKTISNTSFPNHYPVTQHYPSIHIRRYSPFWALDSLIRRLHYPYFQLFSPILLSPAVVMHPSGPYLPIWCLVFPLVSWCRSLHSKPFLEYSTLYKA